MTKEELEKVINVIEFADGGCKYCVANLIEKLKERFPEYSKIIDELSEHSETEEIWGE